MEVEAGWYEDPRDKSRLRWWDGSNWSVETREKVTLKEPGELTPYPFKAPKAKDFLFYYFLLPIGSLVFFFLLTLTIKGLIPSIMLTLIVSGFISWKLSRPFYTKYRIMLTIGSWGIAYIIPYAAINLIFLLLYLLLKSGCPPDAYECPF